jgi:hypothetical protein
MKRSLPFFPRVGLSANTQLFCRDVKKGLAPIIHETVYSWLPQVINLRGKHLLRRVAFFDNTEMVMCKPNKFVRW